jgi:hypothetical protein
MNNYQPLKKGIFVEVCLIIAVCNLASNYKFENYFSYVRLCTTSMNNDQPLKKGVFVEGCLIIAVCNPAKNYKFDKALRISVFMVSYISIQCAL